MGQGKFVWYELMTADAEAAKAFYGAVVGWTMRPAGMGSSDYTVLHAGEAPIGGLMAMPKEAGDNGARPGWIGYIGVPDVDAAAAEVAAHGGKVLRAPDVMEGVGRFAVAADPHGAAFVLFTSDHPEMPAPPMDAPGACGWRELMAGELDAAFAFYAAVFGWTKGQTMPMGEMGDYQLFKTGGEADVGGMMTKPPQVPAPPYWAYYFNVDSIAAAVDRLTGAGGTVINGPMEVPGPMWVVQGLDPQGTLFSLLSSRP